PARVRARPRQRAHVGAGRQRPRLDPRRGRRADRVTWTARQIREVPKTGPHWRSLRLELGVQAFGVNSTHGNAGDLIVLEHDESLTGYEELYVVLTGHASFEVNGEETDAPAGTLVFVHDAGATRRARALRDATD